MRERAELLARAVRRHPVLALLVLAVAIPVVLALVSQLRVLGSPMTPYEAHHWRQSFTYGVAWNFAHGRADFFHPRMLWIRASGTNVVEMEAPVYPWVCGWLLRVFGDVVWPCRALSLAGFALSVTFTVRTFFRGDPHRAVGFVAFLALSPMAWCEFRQVQPDPSMVSLAMIAASIYVRYGRTPRPALLAAGAAVAALAILTKPIGLAALPALVILAMGDHGSAPTPRAARLRRGLFAALSLLPALAAMLAWDRWARGLQHAYAPGDKSFISVDHDPAVMWVSVRSISNATQIYVRMLPNYVSSWWPVPACLAGVGLGLADRRTRVATLAALAWFVAAGVELQAFGDRTFSNAYYGLVLLFPTAFFAAMALGRIARVLDRDAPIGKADVVLVFFVVGSLLAGPLLASRFCDGRLDPPAGPLCYERAAVLWVLGKAPLRLLGLVTLGASVALLWRPRTLPPWARAIVAALVVVGAVVPLRDTAQFFRYAVGNGHAAAFAADTLELRAAIARFVAPSEPIVVDGTEPISLFLPLRNGYNDFVYAATLAPPPRIYVHYVGSPMFPATDDLEHELLAKGKSWAVHCIVRGTCPPRAQ